MGVTPCAGVGSDGWRVWFLAEFLDEPADYEDKEEGTKDADYDQYSDRVSEIRTRLAKDVA